MYEKTFSGYWWYDEDKAREVQATFEGLFNGHTPKVDTRTPKQVEEQKILEGWH